MKRLIVALVSLFVFSITAQAQIGDGKVQEIPMTQMCMPMMKQMIVGQEMQMQEMMQMMMDMMNMQEKMMKGVKPAEKKKMMKDMACMREKMQRMISMRMGGMMMGMDDLQARLKCAEEWLKKAIDLHELHIKDPKTATEASQMEMMEQMKKAYGCIAGTGPEMSGTQPEPAGEKKKDAHGH